MSNPRVSMTRMFVCDPEIKAQLKEGLLNTSATISQALINAHEDDSLLLKALKRRMAMPPSNAKFTDRINFSFNIRVGSYLDDMSARSRLTKEDVIRLAVEAHIYKL